MIAVVSAHNAVYNISNQTKHNEVYCMNIEKMRNAILDKDETNGYIERERAIDVFFEHPRQIPRSGGKVRDRSGRGARRSLHAR